jgi:CDP-paratose 2-epimerase
MLINVFKRKKRFYKGLSLGKQNRGKLLVAWLITGGCGFIGSNLADTLMSEGEEIVVLDNLSRGGSRENLSWLRDRHGQKLHFVAGDVRNENLVTHLIKEVKPIVLTHLAAQVAMTTSIKNPRLDFEVNVRGSINILEAVRLYSPETIVLYSSTNKVYGDLAWVEYEEQETRYVAPKYPEGFDETTPLDFYSPYSCSKGAADQYVLDYARVFGLQTVVFRHSSMYGGRQFATYDQGWIGWFCQKALEMKDPNSRYFTISGNGKQVRDILHIDDLITVYLSAVECIEHTAGAVYNIGGGVTNSLSLLELFALLEEMVGVEMRFRNLDWRLGDQKVFIADYQKALSDFGWLPEIKKEEGLRQMLRWSSSRIQN